MCQEGAQCSRQAAAAAAAVDSQDKLDWLQLPPNHTLGLNTWIVIKEDNRSVHSEMVTESGRTTVVLFGGFLSAWSLLFNLLLCWVLSRTRRAPKTGAGGAAPAYPGRWLVLNFSLAQLLLGAFVIPLNVVTERSGAWRFGPVVCRVWLFTQVLLVSLTVWSLFVLTLDRFLYVVQPLAYTRRLGRKSIVAGIASSWIISLATLIPMILSLDKPDFLLEEVCAVSMTREHAVTMSFAVFLAPALLTLTATIAIVVAALQAKIQQRLLRREALGDEDQGDDSDDIPESQCADSCLEDCCCAKVRCTCCVGRCCPDVSYVTYSEYTNVGGVALAVVVVNVVSIAMWTPFYITNVLIPYCDGVTMCINPALWSLFIWLGYSNAGVSPVLWFIDPDVRQQLRSLVFWRQEKQQQQSQEKCRLTPNALPTQL